MNDYVLIVMNFMISYLIETETRVEIFSIKRSISCFALELLSNRTVLIFTVHILLQTYIVLSLNVLLLHALAVYV